MGDRAEMFYFIISTACIVVIDFSFQLKAHGVKITDIFKKNNKK